MLKSNLLHLRALLLAGLAGLGYWLYQPDLPLSFLRDKYAGPTSRFMNLAGMEVHYR